jgi:hypothetical protein
MSKNQPTTFVGARFPAHLGDKKLNFGAPISVRLRPAGAGLQRINGDKIEFQFAVPNVQEQPRNNWGPALSGISKLAADSPGVNLVCAIFGERTQFVAGRPPAAGPLPGRLALGYCGLVL